MGGAQEPLHENYGEVSPFFPHSLALRGSSVPIVLAPGSMDITPSPPSRQQPGALSQNLNYFPGAPEWTGTASTQTHSFEEPHLYS